MISGFVVGAIYRNARGEPFRIIAIQPGPIDRVAYDRVDYEWLNRGDSRVHTFFASATLHHEYRREEYVIEEYPL